MGKYAGCLLASDYDGTLTDDAGLIPEAVRSKIGEFIAEGGLFTVCTGRTKQGFHAFSPQLINAPVLLANGIMAYDYLNERTVFCRGIDAADALIADRVSAAFSDVCIELYDAFGGSYAIRLNERSEHHFTRQSICWENIETARQAKTPLVKIMVSAGQTRAQEVQRFLDGVIGAYGVKYIPSQGDFVEIINRQADKGAGLLSLAKCLGVAENRVFAIGDGENDLDMLRAAHVAFVPQNGCDAARALRHLPVKSNNDGAVAHAIARIGELIA